MKRVVIICSSVVAAIVIVCTIVIVSAIHQQEVDAKRAECTQTTALGSVDYFFCMDRADN